VADGGNGGTGGSSAANGGNGGTGGAATSSASAGSGAAGGAGGSLSGNAGSYVVSNTIGGTFTVNGISVVSMNSGHASLVQQSVNVQANMRLIGR